MSIDKNFIFSELKQRIDVQYYHKVFNENKEIKPEWMVEPQKPENLVDQIFLKILKILEIPDDIIISQNRVKLYDAFKDKRYRYPDYKLIKDRRSEKNLLIELEPYNSNLEVGVRQAEEWINDIKIGTFNHALAINLNKFILIFFDGKEVKKTELTIEKACKFISEVVFGKKITIRIEDINKITEQFYNQFYAIIHGGSYINTRQERITVAEEDCIINNLLYDTRLVEMEKIEFIYTIFNRLIFIKILIDWNQFPKILPYLREVPKHLIHTELNNLFFKTLAIKEEKRVNLPKEFEEIPFLNGGLFRITKIEKENPDLMINPKYLVKIFDFLEEYSFLENGDDNSSINSEILGYIFEKTIEFRKGTGSYYTHNLICDFMCENVLYPHLLSRINSYLKTLDYKEGELLEKFEEIFMLREKTLLNIYKLIIKNLKVCDICVGSGAFLLAMGNLLLEIHKRIRQILHIDIDDTEIKQFIVEYNLFGVDIMLSAIQICQLRLWLWISEASEKLLPLPNIEYNLRVGNTLLGSDSRIDISTVNYKFINKMKGSKFINQEDPKFKPIMEDLENGIISFSSLKELKTVLLELYIYSHDENTNLLKDLIEDLNELIIDDADRIYLNVIQKEVKKQKLKKELSVTFLRRMKAFHWYLEFPHIFPKGFDIIVGNPPYVSIKFMEKIPLEQDIQSLEKEVSKKKRRIKKLKTTEAIDRYKSEISKLEKEIKEKKALLSTPYYQQEKIYNSVYKEFLKNKYEWAYKIYDILIPFFERGFNLLKNNGRTYLSFITSNKFLATDYGIKIRESFLNNYQIDLLVDISMIKVFKDAAVYPIIISVKNSGKKNLHKILVGRYRDINELGASLSPIEQERYNKEDLNYLIYIPLYNKSFELFDLMVNHPDCLALKDIFENYYRHFDFTNWGDYEVFVKSDKGKELGEDYYLYVTNNNISPFQININPQLYFHKEIPQEENPKNLSIAQSKWDVFKEKLLMIKEVALDLICALGENYTNIGKIYALKIKENSDFKEISNYYFLALLNSKLLDFYFRVVFWNTHLSGGYLNYHFSYLSILPILKIDSNSYIYKRIIVLSKCLATLYNENLRNLIDLLVIHAYFPDDLIINLNEIEYLDDYYNGEISLETLYQIINKTNEIENYIKELTKHNYYQIIINERQFKD